jgi:hypothetical protein
VADELNDARLKIDRARHHLSDLDAVVESFNREADRDRILVDYDPDEGCHVAYLKGRISPFACDPGLIVGDAIQTARAALDYVAWHLALQHLGREPNRTEQREIQFPITEKRYFGGSKVLKHVSDTAAKELRLHQPWVAGKEPLGLLHFLSNQDKHRVLVSRSAVEELSAPEWEATGPMDDIRFEPWDLSDDDQVRSAVDYKGPGTLALFRLFVVPPEAAAQTQIQVKAKVSYDVAFGGPSGDIDRDALKAVVDCVEQVVGAFDRFL